MLFFLRVLFHLARDFYHRENEELDALFSLDGHRFGAVFGASQGQSVLAVGEFSAVDAPYGRRDEEKIIGGQALYNLHAFFLFWPEKVPGYDLPQHESPHSFLFLKTPPVWFLRRYLSKALTNKRQGDIQIAAYL
jgi:hypothetical protein